jgi:hypothetical protein
MRTLSVLLALVVVLSAREVGAAGAITVDCHYIVGITDHNWFGFRDLTYTDGVSQTSWTQVGLGPLGIHKAPFTATQGLVGSCVILAMLVIVPLVLTVRWKRKKAIA